MAQRCSDKHTYTQQAGKIPNTDEALNTSLAWDESFSKALHFPILLPSNVTQMCHQTICLKLTKSYIKRLFVQRCTWHLLVPPLPARASPLLQKIPVFCWLRLQQEDNSQTTGWRWTQPAQSSLSLSVLTPHCLPWFFSPFALDNWVMPEL